MPSRESREGVPPVTKEKNPYAGRPGATHVEAVKERFPGAVTDVSWSTDYQPVITVDADSAPGVIEYLYYERGGWMPVMAANDERPLINKFALYYILSMEEQDKCMLTVRCELDPVSGEFQAVSARVPAAVWSEREAQDLFGLTGRNILDNRNLVLPDDWPQDLHPLRKDSMDYRFRPAPTREIENYDFLKDTGDHETRVIPMGPMHITSDEPAHFRLYVEGEQIIDADYRMFFIHRGMEKCAESRLNYDGVNFLAERICGICGYAHSVAYAETVERAQGIEVPKRAQYIRSILMEVERLHSHLLNLGLVCHYTGFDTGFQHFFRIREDAMDLAEILTGARKTYGLNIIGGVRRDILASQTAETFAKIDKLRDDTKRLCDQMLSTPNFRKRVEGVGILAPKIARDYSPVGPVVRGSGFARDTRWVHPFEGYQYIADHHKPFTEESCDVKGRTLVRVHEVLDSMDIVEELLRDELPAGPILNDKFHIEPGKFAIGYDEAPRGENVHWSMIGNNQKTYRWRAKAATYSNWPVLRYMFRGNTISDAALIVGSIDPCYSCTERVSIVDVKKRKEQILTKQQFEEYGRTQKHSPIDM